jgi:hypothetical protein
MIETATRIAIKSGTRTVAYVQVARNDLENARLIELAPELFELVKLFRLSVEYEIRRSEKDGDTEGVNLKRITLKLIDTAIAKVEGA